MSAASDGYKFVDNATHSGLVIKGGTYIMLVHATAYGTVKLNLLAADNVTYVNVLTFNADGYQEVILPPGQVQIQTTATTGAVVSLYRASYD